MIFIYVYKLIRNTIIIDYLLLCQLQIVFTYKKSNSYLHLYNIINKIIR